MKHADIQKHRDAGSITARGAAGTGHWRIEDISAQRGYSIHKNSNPEEI